MLHQRYDKRLVHCLRNKDHQSAETTKIMLRPFGSHPVDHVFITVFRRCPRTVQTVCIVTSFSIHIRYREVFIC